MDDDDYPWDMGRSLAEVAFLSELKELSGHRAHFDVWDLYPQLVVMLTIADFVEEPTMLRTLRVDFSGDSLSGGNDPEHQIDRHLDPEDPDFFERDGLVPKDAAAQAFSWFRLQGLRPIERREWSDGSDVWCQWVLAERPTVVLAAKGRGRPDRPPDQVVLLDQPRRL